jgi:CubicO group peptidase (beta-lactamase class C family)
MVRFARVWSSAALVAAAGLSVALGVMLGPAPVALPSAATGDADLVSALQRMLGPRPGTRAIAVALVEPDATRVAGLGTSGDPHRPQIDERTAFEIGSVTKGLNGMLLASLVADGVVSLEQRVGDIVTTAPLAQSDAGDVTLVELAQHRAGLPRVATGGPITLLRSGYTAFAGADPYPVWTRNDLFDQVARIGIRRRGTFAYSNAGAALLGHTLAVAGGRPYPALLAERVLRPLDLTDTMVATAPDVLPAIRARGTSYTGRPREPWTGDANAPAGTVWS